MFVVSMLDSGEERNFLALGLTLKEDIAFVDVGGVKHRFLITDIIAILPIDNAEKGIDRNLLKRSCRVN
ncbi:hypothetical protein AJ87_46465 [Rhizobium yanglingense]|nr:hypothetical protein AJ87_46465 [Rhizobium yanglingense]